jgi:hypothetical protein
MVSADCELASIFRNIGQRISQNGYVARFRDFLARGVKARELRRQAQSSRASMACRSARAATATGFATSRVRPAFRTRSLEYGPRAGGATEADEAGAPRSFRKSRKRAIASAPRPPPQKKHASRRIFPPPGGVRNVPTCFLILGGSHLAISASPESQGSSIPVEARVEGSSAIARSPFSEALFSFAFSFAR